MLISAIANWGIFSEFFYEQLQRPMIFFGEKKIHTNKVNLTIMRNLGQIVQISAPGMFKCLYTNSEDLLCTLKNHNIQQSQNHTIIQSCKHVNNLLICANVHMSHVRCLTVCTWVGKISSAPIKIIYSPGKHLFIYLLHHTFKLILHEVEL